MRTKLSAVLAIAVFLSVGLAGCGVTSRTIDQMTTEEKAFKVLSTSLSVYNLTMESVSQMQVDGYLSVERRAKINKIAGKYRLAHLAASRALYAYKALSDASNERRLIVALGEAQRAFTDFLDFVEPILQERIKK